MSDTETKAVVSEVMTAFEEFKRTNDERLASIEKKTGPDPVVEEKLEKINQHLNQFEPINQKLTLAEGRQKAVEQMVEDIKLRIARIPAAGGDVKKGEAVLDEYKAGFIEYMRKHDGMDPDALRKLKQQEAEIKALVAGIDNAAGYLLAPPAMDRDIIKDIVEVSPIRALVRVSQIGVESWKGVRRISGFTARRVGETNDRSETAGLAYGLIEIRAPEMYAYVDISQQMLEDSAYNLEAELGTEFAEQFAAKEDIEFVSGAGALQLEGILTAADIGETVSGAAAAVTGDGLINLSYSIKAPYARTGTWVLNRKSVGAIRLLKEGGTTGAYVWQPGLATNVPNTILGSPYAELSTMPDIAAGAYPIAFGDWRRAYRLIDRVALGVMRDPYSKSDNGLISFKARRRVGGAVTLPSAIVKMKIAAA